MKTHRIAVLFSGGKDSMYIIHLWYKLMSELPRYLIFIRPRWESPHELNIHVVSILAKLLGANLTLTTSEKLVETLRKLDIDVLLSADVYVYDHVYWLERVCRKANVELVEPILNEDTYNVLQEIINLGIEFIIISVKPNYEKLLGWVVSRSNINEFIELIDKLKVDPIGENGEYHTIVIKAPLLKDTLNVYVMRRYVTTQYITLGINYSIPRNSLKSNLQLSS